MKKYRYLNTDCFNVGEEVWVTGVKFLPSGRLRYNIRPIRCKITKKSHDWILVESSNLSYYSPSKYYISTPEKNVYYDDEYSLNLNIAKTREEAIENYNYRLISEIEKKFLSFKRFEERAKSRLL